ncbi:MAG: DUF4097 family beta strand repeat protein, partial [Clostridia bacterium]|nr:DUF4097 family beta strand repeat protein [Clostridia bacterium]
MKKAILITATVLVVTGLAIIAGVFIFSGFNITQLDAAQYFTKEYSADAGFHNIKINVKEADIIFKRSENEECKAVFYERERVTHSVTVEDDTLDISVNDERKLYERIGFSFKKMTVTLYLPSTVYERLEIVCGTGDVTIPEGFAFDSVTVSASTGNVTYRATSPQCKITASTGDIAVENTSATNMELSVSTGKISVKSLFCGKDLYVHVSTGKTTLDNVDCKYFGTDGSTGDITLKDVVAEEISVERSTGDVAFENSDAAKI